MARKLTSFIDAFCQYTEGKGSPLIWRKWAAIFIVAAVMERKVWLKTSKGQLFPNQYIVLVGPAGVGKSLCVNLIYELIEAINSPETPLHIAPTSVSKASLIDALHTAERRIVRPMEMPSVQTFNSLIAVPSEFGVFLPAWEGDFMATLTHMWDNGSYRETRRSTKLDISIPKAQINLFSATTPSHLNGLLPDGAWEQGFMSRMLCVFSCEEIIVDLFADFPQDDDLRRAMLADLRDIYRLWGGMTVTDEAKDAINQWVRSGGSPRPDHPKLMSYCSRRAAHVLKLCIVAAAATSDDMTITIDHFAEALDWLVEAETYMPDIFKSMKAGGDGAAIEECWHFAYQHYMKHNTPIPEPKVIQFLQERVPAHSVVKILDVMERAGLMKKQMITGGTGWIPSTKQPQ